MHIKSTSGVKPQSCAPPVEDAGLSDETVALKTLGIQRLLWSEDLSADEKVAFIGALLDTLEECAQ